MEKKITKWTEKGLITKETALSLLEDIKLEKAKNHKIRMNITIYTIAAILIGIGIITFISANDWLIDFFKNLASFIKILLMFILTAACFWGGYQLAYEKETFPKLGGALIVLSSLLIGATYALTGQIYNINANSTTLVFVWLVSILPVAFIYKSFPVNIISIILYIIGIINYYGEFGIDEALTWVFFVPLIMGVSLYSIGNIPFILSKFNKFSLSYKIVGLVPIFFAFMVLICSPEETYKLKLLHYFVPVVFLIILNIFNYLKADDKKDKLLTTETAIMGSISIFMLAVLLFDFYEYSIMVLANIAIVAIIYYGYDFGYKSENQRIIVLTNWFLIIYILTNYCRWGWSSLNKSLFFILGGVILLSVGIFLEKKRKAIKGDKNEP